MTKVKEEFEILIKWVTEACEIAEKKTRAAIELLQAGNTIPFIARYRKEATGGLDEMQLRAIEDSFAKVSELQSRKATILKSIAEQDALTDDLRQKIEDCFDKAALEAIYLPYKPKRRTRATIARERGLEPLAKILLRQEPLGKTRTQQLDEFVDPNKEVPDRETALAGACDIVAEVWSERADVQATVAQQVPYAEVFSAVKRGKRDDDSKFKSYFDYHESMRRIPSHRFLAMSRGESEGILRVGIRLDDDRIQRSLRSLLISNPQFEFSRELKNTVDDSYQRLVFPSVESSTLSQLKEKADEDAIGVFAKNLRDLLLAPPAGQQVTLGIDPGFRTGCKLAVVDETGKFLTSRTIYPTAPRNDIDQAEKTVADLIESYGIRLIAIGNGTASRETDSFVADLIRKKQLDVTKVVVSESGASIYSASELAVKEYPDLDVTVRGAISIAHRLQDPLAELVKLDPKSIGVGQYQHDVDQSSLRKALDREVESCVTSVGVELNQASAALLSHVSGIGPKLAENIVTYRDSIGRFDKRVQLSKVPKLGPKAFQQAAGFLRIRDGAQPLDNSAVHPESYYIVDKMATQIGRKSSSLIGQQALLDQLDPQSFVDDSTGLPTVSDILSELAKPGRDPRNEFKVARFTEDIQSIDDLRPEQVLEGSVTNVTKFGAFVDIGVHQDGLIHISELDNRFVHDPAEVVSVGDIVRVKVLEVDKARKRISLSRKQLMAN